MKHYTSVPTIQVGIVKATKIEFVLNGEFRCNNERYSGKHCITLSANGKLQFLQQELDDIHFEALDSQCSFDLIDVVIGIHFHWERKETQRFNGDLRFIVLDGLVQAINIVQVEDYLTSVISSEMSATSSLELLKAHAVISRSWLMNKLTNKQVSSTQSAMINDEDRIIKWYDHQDHTHFDVCADDHCQRYQGITKESTQTVRQAIQETYGKILSYNDSICDARFYKSCGGATELFENCWEPVHHNYLLAVADTDCQELPDLTQEEQATKWILASPKSYCNTKDKKVLAQVLNNYDQETPDFYRWTVRYSQEEISQLILTKSGIDFGMILDLVPIRRGASGRLIELKIIGEKKSMIIGKELEIRKYLSKSHLYSSAFVVSKEYLNGKLYFTLNGAGWGHGVGLCQIGAAMMASQGIDYQTILKHYYPNSQISTLYKKETL